MRTVIEFHLQAKPDFSSFWFPIGAKRETFVYVNFIPQTAESVSTSVERHHLHEENTELEERDVDSFVFGVLLAIEFYSGLYPDKCLLCKSDDPVQSIIFRMILRSNRHILERVFSVIVADEKGEIDWPSYGEHSFPGYTLKRICNTPAVQADMSNYKYNVHSAFFNLSVTVQMLIHFHSQLN